MPKIIIGVSSSFCAHFLKGQIRFLRSKGYDILLISSDGEEITALAKEEDARLKIVNFKKRIDPFHDFRVLIQLFFLIRNERPDIIHAQNPKPGLLLLLAAFFHHHPARLFTLHGLVSDARSGWKRRLIAGMEWLTCKLAHRIIVVSPSLLQHAIQRKIVSTRRSLVIAHGSANGINLEVYTPAPEQEPLMAEIRHMAGLPPDKKVIGFFGRISHDKGVDMLFQAFNLLRKEIPDLALLFVGPIEEEDPILASHLSQLRNAPDVFYLGKLQFMPPAYRLIDILVLPSLREGFGNVLIEAAAMEIPVIAPDVPGCQSAFQDGFNGLSFPKGNAEELADRLRIYLQDPERRMRDGRNGRTFVTAHFSQSVIWEGMHNIYQQMLKV